MKDNISCYLCNNRKGNLNYSKMNLRTISINIFIELSYTNTGKITCLRFGLKQGCHNGEITLILGSAMENFILKHELCVFIVLIMLAS